MSRRMRIAFPGALPAWRQAMSNNGTFQEISNTAISTYYTPNAGTDSDPFAILSGWNGFASDRAGKLWNNAASGHGCWLNASVSIDLNQDAPIYTVDDQGSVYADVVPSSDYYNDPDVTFHPSGRPTGRHQYYSPQHIPAVASFDGKERVLLIGSGSYAPVGFSLTANPTIAGWKIADTAWDASTVWSNNIPISGWGYGQATCFNPLNNTVLVSTTDNAPSNLAYLDPSTKAWTTPVTSPIYPSTDRLSNILNMPMLVDTSRNKLVSFNYIINTGETQFEFSIIDISKAGSGGDPWTVTKVFPTGADVPIPYLFGMVHDLDNDRYLILKATQSVSCKLYSVDATALHAAGNHGTVAVSYLTAIDPLYGSDSIVSKFHYHQNLGGCSVHRIHNVNMQFFPTR